MGHPAIQTWSAAVEPWVSGISPREKGVDRLRSALHNLRTTKYEVRSTYVQGTQGRYEVRYSQVIRPAADDAFFIAPSGLPNAIIIIIIIITRGIICAGCKA